MWTTVSKTHVLEEIKSELNVFCARNCRDMFLKTI